MEKYQEIVLSFQDKKILSKVRCVEHNLHWSTQKLDGKITLQNNPGGGVKFIILLPIK